MAQLGANDLLGSLWERFNNDATLTLFLVVYIVGHLLAYVVLAIALSRFGRVIISIDLQADTVSDTAFNIR